MALLSKPTALFETIVTETIDENDTTIPLNSLDDSQGSTLVNGDTVALTLDEGEDSGNADYGQEYIIGTVDTAGVRLTSCLRGVSLVDGITEVTANKKKHRRGASAKMTSHPHLVRVIRLLNGEDGIDPTALIKYSSAPTFTPGSQQLATIAYADALAIAGSPDATTTQKGISKISVAPVDAAQPIAVGDNDPRMLSQAENDFIGAITASAAEINVLDGADANFTTVNLNEAMGFFANFYGTATAVNAVTDGSDADAYHTHPTLSAGFRDEAQTSAGAACTSFAVGYSDAATDLIAYAGKLSGSTTGYHKVLQVAEDYGKTLYVKTATTGAAIAAGTTNSIVGVVAIGSDLWAANNDATAGDRIYKNAAGVTIVNGPINDACSLGYDATNSYLLLLNTTTQIKRFSGVAGTTITHVDDITLDTAVTASMGFIYDDTNDRYICIDKTNNIIRRFNSSGTTVDTVAYTVDDTYVRGLAFIGDRVHLVIVYAQGYGLAAEFIPTSMTR